MKWLDGSKMMEKGRLDSDEAPNGSKMMEKGRLDSDEAPNGSKMVENGRLDSRRRETPLKEAAAFGSCWTTAPCCRCCRRQRGQQQRTDGEGWANAGVACKEVHDVNSQEKFKADGGQ